MPNIDWDDLNKEPERSAWEALVAYAYKDDKDGPREIQKITTHYLRLRDALAQLKKEYDDLAAEAVSAACEECNYLGDDAESAIACMRSDLSSYSKLMWDLQRACNADSAKPDDVLDKVKALSAAVRPADNRWAAFTDQERSLIARALFDSGRSHSDYWYVRCSDLHKEIVTAKKG